MLKRSLKCIIVFTIMKYRKHISLIVYNIHVIHRFLPISFLLKPYSLSFTLNTIECSDGGHGGVAFPSFHGHMIRMRVATCLPEKLQSLPTISHSSLPHLERGIS